jgi:hypothetical protein
MTCDGMACDCSCVCVCDSKRVSVDNTAARNECADVSQPLSVLKSMVVDLREAPRVLHVQV